MDDRRKRRRVRLLQKYLVNPPVKFAVFLGLVPGHAIIETIGRKTGRRRRTVVGVHQDGSMLWIIAEQGRHSGYVRNLEAEPRVRVRHQGRWRSGMAKVMESDDPHARLDTFGRPGHASVVRRVGTELLTVCVELVGA